MHDLWLRRACATGLPKDLDPGRGPGGVEDSHLGGTVSLHDVRGHLLTLRLNPTFEKGTSERRHTIFQYRLCLLALVPGLYREYLAMFAWPIAPMFEPVRFEGHVDNLTEDDVARHLAQCRVTLHQVDDIQPYARHWLSCCLDTCHGFLMDDECAVLSERLAIAASPDASTTLSLKGRAELETIAHEQGTELPDTAPALRLFLSLDDEQMSLLADPPTVHNLVTASVTSGLVAGGFAANNPLADVDHEMATVVPNNERQLIIGRPCNSPPPGQGAVSLNYGEGDVPVNMSVDAAHVLGDPTGHPNVPANKALPSVVGSSARTGRTFSATGLYFFLVAANVATVSLVVAVLLAAIFGVFWYTADKREKT
ncbi:hypothetical protein BV22DRAFT_1052507 [Leucogyrophana mollusca]|uniref:Uncharacterized protein n=1 Tax=Leucogyrophana mollusca TaxID=85980 RepID=A0ACB8AVE1_9AGAM|nr:hypothetical protein BV22DRAFT_1052507 [Leucogyrophana mollusca]